MTDHRLLELKIEVNRKCPLHCLHCSSNGTYEAPQQLEPSTVTRLIKEFVDLGGKKLCISGGEPLCYRELSAIINSCQLTNIDVSLYTTGIFRNGGPATPIPEKTADILLDKGVRIIFSLHGAYPKTHDALTGVHGSFKTTLTAIEKVAKAGASIGIHVVPTAINFGELTDIAKLADQLSVRKVSWLRFVPQGRGLINKRLLQLSREQLRELGTKKIQLERMCSAVTIRTGAPFNILCPPFPRTCEAGLSVLTVNPDGSVSPCDAFKQFKSHDDFGNILHHSLTEVWHKSHVLNAVRALHESKLNSSCSSCPLYSKCNSGCLAQKAIASGMLTDGRDPDCLLSDVEVDRDEIEAVTIC